MHPTSVTTHLYSTVVLTIRIWRTMNHYPNRYLWRLNVIFHRLNLSFLRHQLFLILLLLISSVSTRTLFFDPFGADHRALPNSRTISLTSHMTPSSILICSYYCVDLIFTSPHAKIDNNFESEWLWKMQKTSSTINLAKSMTTNHYLANPLISLHSIFCHKFIGENRLQFRVRMTRTSNPRRWLHFVDVIMKTAAAWRSG